MINIDLIATNNTIYEFRGIEGATMSLGGLTNREVFTQNIDVIMKYFEELLKELDR